MSSIEGPFPTYSLAGPAISGVCALRGGLVLLHQVEAKGEET